MRFEVNSHGVKVQTSFDNRVKIFHYQLLLIYYVALIYYLRDIQGVTIRMKTVMKFDLNHQLLTTTFTTLWLNIPGCLDTSSAYDKINLVIDKCYVFLFVLKSPFTI